MSYSVHFNTAINIIEIKVEGTVNLDEFKEIVSHGMLLAKEKGCFHILADYREASVINLSTFEVYNLPKLLSEISSRVETSPYKFKRAVVFAPKDIAIAKLAETVAVNRSQNAKIFEDIDEAKKWLIGK